MSLNLKYHAEMGKDLFSMLKDRGHLVYGGAFSGELVQEKLGINIPETEARVLLSNTTLAEIKDMLANLTLIELAAIGYIKDELLKQGMALVSRGGDYRILLPSENAKQIRNYQSSASRKLLRALKLIKNSPDKTVEHDKKEVRLVMQRASIREDMRQAEHMT